MRLERSFPQMAGAIALLCASGWAQTTTRASVDSAGVQGNNDSYHASISGDGRFVAFYSKATNLVPGDSNGVQDAFVRDLQTGVTERVSVDSAETQANGSSGNTYSPSISGDGRYVAFESAATNLVPADTNGSWDIFVRDRQSGTTERVGVQGNGHSYNPSISSNGRYVAFESAATNLVAGDTNASVDVFVYDRQTFVTTRVSLDSAAVQGNNGSYNAAISSDGRYVAFWSDSDNLAPGDTNTVPDVFVRDRQTGLTTRVSVDSGGAEGNGDSYEPSISADGRYVAFWSYANNLVPLDTNGVADVFVHDRQSNATTRVSVDSLGLESDNDSFELSISADGRFVAFWSNADNLVPGDTNLAADIFLRFIPDGTTRRLSVSSGGVQGNQSSFAPSISANGSRVAFESQATNLVSGDTNGFWDVFVLDRRALRVFTPFCFGDGTSVACPCGNTGAPEHGCENSSGTGGALLTATGLASLSGDTLQLTSSGEKPTTLSIFLQGNASIAPVNYGDGLRCVGGAIKHLRSENAVGGIVIYPDGTETPISVRSAQLGDSISVGSTRNYQVYYRDSVTSFCPAPMGDLYNLSRAIGVTWVF
jgi:Tol biopolymer transport system component